jgi:hypothetical protein
MTAYLVTIINPDETIERTLHTWSDAIHSIIMNILPLRMGISLKSKNGLIAFLENLQPDDHFQMTIGNIEISLEPIT